MCGHTTARARLRTAIEKIACDQSDGDAEILRARLEDLDQKIGALDHAMGNAQLQRALGANLPRQKSIEPDSGSAKSAISTLEREQIRLMTLLKTLTENIMQLIDLTLNEAPVSASNEASLRAITPADDAFLFCLFRAVKSDELGPMQWDQVTLDILMRTQYNAHEQHYRALPDAHDLLVLKGNEAIGRMIVTRDGRSIHLGDISLLPEHRGTGIGRFLIGKLQQEAAANGLPLRLRVIPTNRAVNLYRRMEFAFTDDGEPYRLMEWRPSR